VKKKKPTLYLSIMIIFFATLSMTGCSTLDPRRVDIELPVEPPLAKETIFDQALKDLGKMTEIYGNYSVTVQSIVVGDETGVSHGDLTQGEIPQRISEMTNSSLNAIGGKIVFIPYLPNYINSMQTVGYSNLERKRTPDVILTGGITEFDRGLGTRGENTDYGFGTEPLSDATTFFDSQTINADYSSGEKVSVATITLDSNLIDYQTFAGISGVQAVNTIKVFKANKEKELGFSLFGPSFGLMGSILKVQGRHAAVRLLVQLNTIEVIGKLYNLPYWRLLPNFSEDTTVLTDIGAEFLQWDEITRIIKTQELLFLSGYDILVTGNLDSNTLDALRSFDQGFNSETGEVSVDMYIALYQNVPLNNDALARRKMFDRQLQVLLQSIQQGAILPAPGSQEVEQRS